MDRVLIERLLEDLKNSDKGVRDRATDELWRNWFEQKGVLGLELLRRSQVFLEAGETERAEEILTDTISSQPDFAEAWNRRAVLYYVQEKFEQSRDDCQEVVRLNPIHFGAWHGLGLCHVALGDYQNAIAAFRKALEIQPYALINQKLILECTARLN